MPKPWACKRDAKASATSFVPARWAQMRIAPRDIKAVSLQFVSEITAEICDVRALGFRNCGQTHSRGDLRGKVRGRAVLNMNARERLTRKRRSASEPQTNAPAAASALPHVWTEANTRPASPASATQPGRRDRTRRLHELHPR